jgi:DNA polymerase-3 subunit alpha
MHMVLIAKDNIGYSRLLEVVSEAALTNFYYKPRIFKEHLRRLGGHVVATSACLGGIIAKRLHFKTDQYGRATEVIDENGIIERELKFYRDIFEGNFYLELQVWDNGDRFQPTYNEYLKTLADKHQLPMVITADAHYLKKEDEKLHEMLMAMQMKMTVEEYKENSDLLYGPYFYVASPKEMLQRAQQVGREDAYYNTGKIADQCNVEVTLGEYQEPLFNIKETEDYAEFLQWKQQYLTENPSEG